MCAVPAVREVNRPTLHPRDGMLGDGDEERVIPARLAEEIAGIEVCGDFVLDRMPARAGILGRHPMTDPVQQAAFAGWRKHSGRRVRHLAVSLPPRSG